jgi:hypothetical protein
VLWIVHKAEPLAIETFDQEPDPALGPEREPIPGPGLLPEITA